MGSTRIKKPGSKRKQRRTRRKRGVKGGTLSNCIKECTKQCHVTWEGLPTKENPTKNGWYMTRHEETMHGMTYVTHTLHHIMNPATSVSFPKHINLIDAFKNFETNQFDLPMLGYISSSGYVLRIDDQNKLVWKRGDKLKTYVHGEEPTD
jgi:hypothetical protein